jgi:alkylation response protein AidB-like acyl-CoA dehydrogenase
MSAIDVTNYRDTVRAWLQAHAPSYSGKARHGIALSEDLKLGRQWQNLKAEHGYAAINLPTQYGGGGGSEIQKIIFATEEAKYDLPTNYFGVSLGMPVPMMLKYASEAVKTALIPAAIRGDQIWCQLFSEPAAGSDLAALTMKATRQGDGWILEGQKLWTTWAQFSDWGVVVVRTDPQVPKHSGLTYFYVDMHSPGVDVRPIRKLAGESEINEVFFDRVYVPDSQRMGDVGGGFKVALETLMVERYAISDETLGGISIEHFIEIAERCTINGKSALSDGEVRRFIADAVVERQGLRSIHRRAMDAIFNGLEPGPEGAIRKLLAGRRRQQMSALAMDLMGVDGVLLSEFGQTRDDATHSWIEAPPLRIAGGTDEVLLNTIAERVLGLPQDYRPDKGIPFCDI